MEDLYSELIHSMRDCLMWCDKFKNITPTENLIPHYLRSKELEKTGKEFSKENFNELLKQRHQMAESSYKGKPISLKEAEDEIRRPDSLLITCIYAMGLDGCEAPSSHGFVDNNGNPPWDSWLAITNVPQTSKFESIISWVPIWARNFVDELIETQAIIYFGWGTVTEKNIEVKGTWDWRS